MPQAPRWPIRHFLRPRGLILPDRARHTLLRTSVPTDHGFLQAFVLFNEADGTPEWALQREILLSPTGSNQTYTFRAGWVTSSNQIEVVGAGGAGAHGASTTTGGGGGAGGGYNSISNSNLSGTATYQIGAGGVAAGTLTGGDTWFNAAAFPASGTAVGAKGGPGPASSTTATGGSAVATASFFPTTSPPARAGGNAASGTSATAGGGGGGAGGPNGVGGAASTTAGGTGDGGTVSAGAAGNPGTSFVGTEWVSQGVGGGAGASNASGGTGGTGKQMGGGAGGGSRSTGVGGPGGDGGIVVTWLSPWWNIEMGDSELLRRYVRNIPFKTS